MADTYFSGQGKVYFQERDASGPVGPMYWIGDADVLQTAGTETTVSFQESWSGTRATVVDVLQNTELTATVGIRNISGKNLATALFGTQASSAGASVTAEAHAAYNVSGNVVMLNNPAVSSVVVKKGATTLVLDTDYSLDATAGTITILPGSTNITATTGAGDAITVDYTFAAYSAKVKALTTTQKEFIVFFDGKDMANGGSKVRVVLKRFKPGILANFDWIGTDVAQMSISGKVLPAQNETDSPYMDILVA